ncbi:MAG TPA: carbohydrate kinase family protein, partial [Blastocatellia bacterium]|nr:carbohydrate kinase family protein [Blastocatellia bacterium]
MAASQGKGIACAGNWTVDLVKVIDCYPPENTLANILGESMGGGGCAHNVTLNLAKFDDTLDLYALGAIGNDPHGDYMVAQCSQFPNINTSQLRRTNSEKTSYTDVFCVKGTGQRTFFHYPGANRVFSPQAVTLDDLPVGWFHLGYLLLLDGMDQPDGRFKTVAARFLHEVQERNIKTSIDLTSEDTDQYRRIVPPSLEYTNYCIINDFEAEKLSGLPLRSGTRLLAHSLKKTANALLNHGVNDLVVIHFPEGAYLLSRDGSEMMQPSLQLPDDFIVGSTGAGDSFCAGMLYGFYQGWSHDKTLRFAVCAGGMNLSDLTTTGGIKPWKEIFGMEE